jgi:hypothetical protein
LGTCFWFLQLTQLPFGHKTDITKLLVLTFTREKIGRVTREKRETKCTFSSTYRYENNPTHSSHQLLPIAIAFLSIQVRKGFPKVPSTTSTSFHACCGSFPNAISQNRQAAR